MLINARRELPRSAAGASDANVRLGKSLHTQNLKLENYKLETSTMK